jgi:glycosyltransferase involved in cell wall biosynthesis
VRLLYVTYKVDAHDALVGYVVGWLQGLALHFEQIEVVCLAAGEASLPPNVQVHSLGKERGLGRVARALAFPKLVWDLRSKVDIVFCQFSPEYILAVAPLAKLKGWPMALWYTHRQVSVRLRLATALTDRILTASPESFRLESAKIRVIGHGIDVARFAPNPAIATQPGLIVAVGRRAPIKHYELLIEAVRLLVKAQGLTGIRVRIIGGDEGNAPSDYATTLQKQIDAAELTNVIKLVGPVGYDQMPQEYQRAALHINLAPTGGMDKAVLEGLAAGVPTLVINETFRALLSAEAEALILPNDKASTLAGRMAFILDLPEGERRGLGERLRARVVAEFGQKALVERLAKELLALSTKWKN